MSQQPFTLTSRRAPHGALRHFWSPSMSTIVHVTSSSDPTLVVFGRDGSGKPRASWFDAVSAELATKAAALMKMRVLRIETEEQRTLARQVAPGRVFASGRALLPFAGAS